MYNITQSKVYLEGDERFWEFDTLYYRDQWWLVAGWLKYKAKKLRQPTRIILLDSLEHQKMNHENGFGFLLKNPIPKSVFFGDIRNIPKNEFYVVENPDIQLPLQE